MNEIGEKADVGMVLKLALQDREMRLVVRGGVYEVDLVNKQVSTRFISIEVFSNDFLIKVI
jgi:hypothetical protein